MLAKLAAVCSAIPPLQHPSFAYGLGVFFALEFFSSWFRLILRDISQKMCRFSCRSYLVCFCCLILCFLLLATAVSAIAVGARVTVSLARAFSWYQVNYLCFYVFRQLVNAVDRVVLLEAQVVLTTYSLTCPLFAVFGSLHFMSVFCFGAFRSVL